MIQSSKVFTAVRPQYVFVCVAPNRRWSQNRPETITDTLFREVLETTGVRGDPTNARRLGLSFIFSYLHGPPDKMDETLRRLLAQSEKQEVPVLIVLEGRDWWGYRPDLWNWWDPAKPGYDPKNRENVEWTGWGPENAIKISWRNWGSQIRVLPAPNIASPRFREANRVELTRMARIIRVWADHLPPEKKWLCPGVKIGSEVSIGFNAYYYPDGNSCLEKYPDDPSHDPPFRMDRKQGFTSGLVPLGYAALTSKKWKKSGTVTLADHERLASDYLAFIASLCHQAGFSRREVFVHAGGQYAPWEKHYSHRTALNRDATPGWSLYNTHPDQAGDLPAAVAASPNNEWCAAEWLTFANTADEWAADLERALNFRCCRFLSIYNWDGIIKKPEAMEGLRRALRKAPAI
jgi:hypothetical protein